MGKEREFNKLLDRLRKIKDSKSNKKKSFPVLTQKYKTSVNNYMSVHWKSTGNGQVLRHTSPRLENLDRSVRNDKI